MGERHLLLHQFLLSRFVRVIGHAAVEFAQTRFDCRGPVARILVECFVWHGHSSVPAHGISAVTS